MLQNKNTLPSFPHRGALEGWTSIVGCAFSSYVQGVMMIHQTERQLRRFYFSYPPLHSNDLSFLELRSNAHLKECIGKCTSLFEGRSKENARIRHSKRNEILSCLKRHTLTHTLFYGTRLWWSFYERKNNTVRHHIASEQKVDDCGCWIKRFLRKILT